MLGRPLYTVQANGSYSTDTFSGWWQQVTGHGVNASTPNSYYTYNRDALGRLLSVAEPATTQADTLTCMNNADTTSYTYDAFDRLRQATKTGTDSACTNQTTQARAWVYDDFGWLVSEQTPEVPNYEVRRRDGRGNIIAECTGPAASCGATPGNASTQDRISHCYDSTSRLLSSTRQYDLALSPRAETSRCDGQGTTASFEDFYYDSYNPYPGVSLNYGRSNGRLVYGVRHNLGFTNHETVNLGWLATEDLYQYAGVGNRLNQRQMSTFLIGGAPSPMLKRTPEGTTKPTFTTGLADYFTNVKRKLKKHDDGFGTAITATTAAALAPGERVALDATNPAGWFRWWFWYYDGAGRPSTLYYPRRRSTRTT
jgi:hypothetical protein